MARATLIASLTSPPSEGGQEIERLPPEVDILEIRADLTGEPDADWYRQRFAGRLLYTLRSRSEGGRHEGSLKRRHQRLADAAARFDLVDLEADRDLGDQVLTAVPPEKRIISWHGVAPGIARLKARFDRLRAAEAKWYKMVPTAQQEGEETEVISLLHNVDRSDLICFAAGDSGAWTRLISPRIGAAVVFGSVGEDPAGPGQMPIERLCRDFDLPEMRPIEGLFGIVGNPVAHSLSPRLHNAAYQALGLPFVYLPFHVESFGDFWLDVVEAGTLGVLRMPLRGLSVTAPFKATALAVAGATSPRAENIGGANTLVRSDEVWEASTTDPEGVVQPLRQRGVELRGTAVAVVGAGGAGSAAAAGLAGEGAAVTLFNRSLHRREEAERRLHLPCHPLSDFDPSEFKVIVHATALGHNGEIAFPLEKVGPEHTILDLVYGGEATALLREAASRGATTIDGREVLLHQAALQFRLMTGHELPMDSSRKILGLQE